MPTANTIIFSFQPILLEENPSNYGIIYTYKLPTIQFRILDSKL